MSCNIYCYAVLAIVSNSYPPLQGGLPTRYSPVRHSSTQQKLSFSVRLACVKHAASVRPEPGSNSPNKNKNVKAQKNRPNKQTSRSAIPTKNTQKQKTGIKKQTNTLSSSQTTPTQPSAHSTSHAHSTGDSRHVSATRAIPINARTLRITAAAGT